MKRLRALVALAVPLAAAGASVAQTWTKIAPTPSMWGNWDSAFTSPTRGFVCGEMKSLHRTDDGGLTWAKITLPGDQSVPLYNVTFIDQNVGVVAGNSAQGVDGLDVYRTVNGGTTWNRVASFPLGGSWYHQDYVSQTVGFMGSNGAVVRTTDAGLNWQLRSGYPSCPIIYGMDFLDANVGFASGYNIQTDQSGVFKTGDGGQTWVRKLVGGSNDVVAMSPSVLVADVGTSVYRSTDAGESWFLAGVGIFTGFMDMERVDANVVAGVSGAGDIWRSPDGGFNWVRVLVGEGDLPGNWSIRFRNPLDGVVVGVKNLAYETHDGGMTWTRLNRGVSNTWNDIVAFSDSNIAMVGHHGYAQSTHDNAATFDTVLIDPPTWGRDTGFSAVSQSGPRSAIAVGHWGGLARTTDGGKTWENMPGRLGIDYYPNDVKFTDSQNGWVAGFDYTVGPKKYTLRTRDGGETWEAVNPANIPGIAVEVRGPRVWIQTSSEPNWMSTDGGQTFRMVNLPSNEGSSPACADMSFATDNLGYVCGYHGYVAKTTNGGTSWVQVGRQDVGLSILGVVAVGNEVWLCGGRQGGGGAFVKRSLNGGATWQTWSLGGQYSAPTSMARVGSKLFVTGYQGETWRLDGLPRLPIAVGPAPR